MLWIFLYLPMSTVSLAHMNVCQNAPGRITLQLLNIYKKVGVIVVILHMEILIKLLGVWQAKTSNFVVICYWLNILIISSPSAPAVYDICDNCKLRN